MRSDGQLEPEPLIRGRAMIELIAHLDEYQPGLADRVRSHVPTDNLRLLDEALPTDWIPASNTRLVIDGIVAELGERAPQLWCSLVTARLLRTPLLRSFVDAIVRLGGLSPVRFLKALPRGWNNAYKHWGEPRIAEVGERSARVEFLDVAPYLFEHRQHWIAIDGVLTGLVAAAHEQGRARLSFAPDAGQIIADVAW